MLDNVINYNFPAKSKLFVHRVGKSSYALSLGNNDNCNMRKIRPLNQLSGTAERNLEWGDPSSKAEGAIHLGGSERIGPGKF